MMAGNNYIRIYHECEGRIKKSVPRIIDWHHKALRVMTNSDPEGRDFISYLHSNNGYFCSPWNFEFIFESKLKYAEMRHFDITRTSLDDHVREFQDNQYATLTSQSC